MGAFARYISDDYCYAYYVRTLGLWNAESQMWNGLSTRFTTDVSMYVLGMLGSDVPRLLPVIWIVLFVTGVVLALEQFFRFIGWPPSGLVLAGSALLTVVTVIQGFPNISQSFYWMTGSMDYTGPLVASSFALALTLKSLTLSNPLRGFTPFLLMIVGIITGGVVVGFNEPMACIGVTFLVIAVTMAYVSNRRRAAKMNLALILGELIGAIVGLVAMVLGAGAHARQASHGPPAPLPWVFRAAAWDVLGFVRTSMLTDGASYLLLVLFFAFLGWHLGRSQSANNPLRTQVLKVAVFVALPLTILLLLASFVPSRYAIYSLPPQRVLSMQVGILAFGLSLWAFSGAALLSSLSELFWIDHLIRVVGVSAIILLIVFTQANFLFGAVSELPELAHYADTYDHRESEIRMDILRGENRIITYRVVPSSRFAAFWDDIGPEASYWLNECVSGYYGAQSIVTGSNSR